MAQANCKGEVQKVRKDFLLGKVFILKATEAENRHIQDKEENVYRGGKGLLGILKIQDILFLIAIIKVIVDVLIEDDRLFAGVVFIIIKKMYKEGEKNIGNIKDTLNFVHMYIYENITENIKKVKGFLV